MAKTDLLIILAGIVCIAVLTARNDARLRAGGGTALVRLAPISLALAAVGVLLAVRAGILPEWTLVPPFVGWLLVVTYAEWIKRAIETLRRDVTPR